MDDPSRRWLDWAREIQALAQTGRHYAQNEFDRGRADRLLEIAAEIVAGHADLPIPAALAAFRAQPGYVTPKVDVRGAVCQDEKLLLVARGAGRRLDPAGGLGGCRRIAGACRRARGLRGSRTAGAAPRASSGFTTPTASRGRCRSSTPTSWCSCANACKVN